MSDFNEWRRGTWTDRARIIGVEHEVFARIRNWGRGRGLEELHRASFGARQRLMLAYGALDGAGRIVDRAPGVEHQVQAEQRDRGYGRENYFGEQFSAVASMVFVGGVSGVSS